MSKKSRSRFTPRVRRVNFRALGLLAGIMIAVVSAGAGLWYLQNIKGSPTLLVEAKSRLEKKQTSLGLEYLDRYIKLNPSDLDALELKGKTLAELAHTESQVDEAAKVLTAVIGQDKKNERWETRRLLVKTYLKNIRLARAAEAQAIELTNHDAKDADAHRLLAHARQQISEVDKDPSKLEDARKEYEIAETIEPGDVDGARRLAILYREIFDNPDMARKVLDNLVDVTAKTPEKHVKALLVRADYFQSLREPDTDKAEADIDLAFKEAPENVAVLLAAAETAIKSGRADSAKIAKTYLDKIPDDQRGDLNVKVLEGEIDLAERKPEEAIQAWRDGLVRTGGNDGRLTYRLARILMRLGRSREAEPLIEQYRRLTGGEKPIPEAQFLQGLYDLGTSRPVDAIAKFEPIRYKIDRRIAPELYLSLGEAYKQIREEEKALAAFQQAAKLPEIGDSTAPWIAIARLQMASKPNEAVATLNEGLARRANEPNLLASLADAIWQRERRKPLREQSWDELDAVLARLRKAAPGAPELAIIEANYMIVRGNPGEAISHLEYATKLHPKSVDVWLARAQTLHRYGKIAEAIAVTEQAVTEAGPNADFYVARAQCFKNQAEMSKAKATLVDGLSRVPKEQQPRLWKSLGDFFLAQSDPISAKDAYREWAKLDPTNPDPRLALFDIALAAGDEEAIAKAIEAVREVSGPKTYYWRFARVEDLLRVRKGETPDKARDDIRLAEAEKLALDIQVEQPQLPLGFVLEGRVRDAQKQIDPAIAAYTKALTLGGGQTVLERLSNLLTREHRDADLNALRANLGAYPNLVESVAMSPSGKSPAEQLCTLALAGESLALDVRTWRNQVYKSDASLSDAEVALGLLTSTKPTEPGPWIQLFMLQRVRRQPEKAAATIEQIRKKVKTEKLDFLLATCYQATGDLPRAVEAYQRAIKQSTNDTAVLYRAITCFEQAGRRDDAEAVLNSYLARDSSNGWARRTLAENLANRTGNAAAWNKALELIGPEAKPDDVAEDTVTRATVYAQGPSPKHREKSLEILQRLVSEVPNEPALQEKLAKRLYESGQVNEAREHAAKAAAGSNASAPSILFYAGTLLAINDLDNAETQLQRLDAIDPDALPLAELKAKVLLARGKPQEAVNILERAFNDRAASADSLSIGETMIRLLTGMKQYEAAGRVGRKLDEKWGPKGTCLLAKTLVPLGKLDDAAAALEKAAKAGDLSSAGSTALELATTAGADPRWLPLADRYLADSEKGQPPTIELLQKQAVLRHYQKDFQKEVELYFAIYKMKPTNWLFMNNMAWTISENLDHPEQGMKWADEAIKLAGDHAHIRDTRGVIFTRMGKYDEAIKDLEIAARDYPAGSVFYHLARALIKAKRPEDARKWQDLAKKSGLAQNQLESTELTDWDQVMNP